MAGTAVHGLEPDGYREIRQFEIGGGEAEVIVSQRGDVCIDDDLLELGGTQVHWGVLIVLRALSCDIIESVGYNRTVVETGGEMYGVDIAASLERPSVGIGGVVGKIEVDWHCQIG